MSFQQFSDAKHFVASVNEIASATACRFACSVCRKPSLILVEGHKNLVVGEISFFHRVDSKYFRHGKRTVVPKLKIVSLDMSEASSVAQTER